jgi:insertion element IS1 protein InsB
MQCSKCGSNHIFVDCSHQFIENGTACGYRKEVKELCLKMYCNGMGFGQIQHCIDINYNKIT